MNETRLQELMGRLVTDMGGAAMVASVIVGAYVPNHGSWHPSRAS